MTFHVNDRTFADADYAQAEAAAVEARARLIQRWRLLESFGGGEQQTDVAAPYRCVDETETHLWVESPIGLIGIPHQRREHHLTPGGVPVATVSLRVCTQQYVGQPPGEITGIQCSSVRYDDGTSSAYSGVVLGLEQLARRAPAPTTPAK